MVALNLFAAKFVIVCFVGLGGWAGLSDLNKFIIPNRICLALAALYPAYAFSAPVAVDWAGGIGVAAVVFAVGFVFYVFRLTGGGDVKFLTVAALWAGPALILPFLIVVAMTGGVQSLVSMIRYGLSQPRAAAGVSLGMRLAPALRAHVPYGVAIAVGCLFVAGQLLAPLLEI